MSNFIFRGKSTHYVQIDQRKARLQEFLFLLLRLNALSEFPNKEQHEMCRMVFPKLLLPMETCFPRTTCQIPCTILFCNTQQREAQPGAIPDSVASRFVSVVTLTKLGNIVPMRRICEIGMLLPASRRLALKRSPALPTLSTVRAVTFKE